jgi:branched-chain amino acid transport system permease protein
MEMLVQQLVNGITIGCVYTLVALGLTIIFGILDIVNFSHGEFYMLGAFTCYYLISLLTIPYLVAVLLTFLVIGIVGIISEQTLLKPVRHREGHMPGVMITFGLNIILANLALIVFGPAPQMIKSPFANEALSFWGIYTTQQKLLVFALSILFVLGFQLFVKRTKYGRAMRAVALDKATASLMGIDINRVYYLTFGFGCGVAAAAASLFGPMISINTNMGHMAIMKAFVVVILGGMGSILGALAGGMLLGMVEGLTAAYISTSYKDVLGFAIVVIVLLFMPHGLLGKRQSR